MKIKTFIFIIFLCVSVSQPSYAGRFSFLGDFFDFVSGLKHIFKGQNQDFEEINYQGVCEKKGVETICGLLNQPQDIAGDVLRVKVTSLLQEDYEPNINLENIKPYKHIINGVCLNDDTNLESFELEFECFISFLIDKITNENEVFFDTEIKNNDYKKIWLTAEEELISIINETIKQFYGIDDVLTNGFGENKIPLYTRNFVQLFKNVQIAFNKN